jgi:hypothetical protein
MTLQNCPGTGLADSFRFLNQTPTAVSHPMPWDNFYMMATTASRQFCASLCETVQGHGLPDSFRFPDKLPHQFFHPMPWDDFYMMATL